MLEKYFDYKKHKTNFKLLGIELINHALIGVNEMIKNKTPATSTAPKASWGV